MAVNAGDMLWYDGSKWVTSSTVAIPAGSGVVLGPTLQVTDSGATTIPYALTLSHASTVQSLSGFGVGLRFMGQDNGTPVGYPELGEILSQATSIAGSTVSSNMHFSILYGGTLGEVMRLRPVGTTPGQLWCIGDFLHAGANLGFYNASPAAKPTVSGSLEGNLGARSLLAGLSTLGLVIDNTQVNDPNLQSWTWVNQGGASVTSANGAIFLSAPASSGDNLRCRVITAPAGNYTLTVSFLPQAVYANYTLCGLCLRDSVGGGIVTLAYTNNSGLLTNEPCITATKWNSFNSFNANYTTSPSTIPAANWQAGPCMWLQIQDDGTNRHFRVSNDGQNFFEIFSVSRTDFITPNQIGFFVDINNATYSGGMNLLSWQVTTP